MLKSSGDVVLLCLYVYVLIGLFSLSREHTACTHTRVRRGGGTVGSSNQWEHKGYYVRLVDMTVFSCDRACVCVCVHGRTTTLGPQKGA